MSLSADGSSLTRARRFDDVDAALEGAASLDPSLLPGEGRTRELWETLATLAADDVAIARAIEPHLDARAILHQAGQDAGTGAWGVFAAEGGDDPLTATRVGDEWMLSGTKPWCSLASRLDGALVTAHVGDRRGLFAVDLNGSGVQVQRGAWHARGLREIPSGPVTFDNVVASPVNEPGWYLTRPGFAWGGIGVAACWYGGAIGIARSVWAATAKPDPQPLTLMHLGAIDALLQDARRALAEAASEVDAGTATSILAKRVRQTVARACEETLLRAGHALGPAPLALDEAHAKRVADLQLYIRQHHAEKDEVSLGSALVTEGTVPW